jgi:hypothetical protein
MLLMVVFDHDEIRTEKLFFEWVEPIPLFNQSIFILSIIILSLLFMVNNQTPVHNRPLE